MCQSHVQRSKAFFSIQNNATVNAVGNWTDGSTVRGTPWSGPSQHRRCTASCQLMSLVGQAAER
eukprot:366177-Chlamydomonas_euryale.AAC.3